MQQASMSWSTYTLCLCIMYHRAVSGSFSCVQYFLYNMQFLWFHDVTWNFRGEILLSNIVTIFVTIVFVFTAAAIFITHILDFSICIHTYMVICKHSLLLFTHTGNNVMESLEVTSEEACSVHSWSETCCSWSSRGSSGSDLGSRQMWWIREWSPGVLRMENRWEWRTS